MSTNQFCITDLCPNRADDRDGLCSACRREIQQTKRSEAHIKHVHDTLAKKPIKPDYLWEIEHGS